MAGFDIDICNDDFPTKEPTAIPSSTPSAHPTNIPTMIPTNIPSANPTSKPSTHPTTIPSLNPSPSPSRQPTTDPTDFPTYNPTSDPITEPTGFPTWNPTSNPTLSTKSKYDDDDGNTQPTNDDDSDLDDAQIASENPTNNPAPLPSQQPTTDPTDFPTHIPTADPISEPTTDPTTDPTEFPTDVPTSDPLQSPQTTPRDDDDDDNASVSTTETSTSPSSIASTEITENTLKTDGDDDDEPNETTQIPTSSISATKTDLPTDSPTNSPTAGPTCKHPTETKIDDDNTSQTTQSPIPTNTQTTLSQTQITSDPTQTEQTLIATLPIDVSSTLNENEATECGQIGEFCSTASRKKERCCGGERGGYARCLFDGIGEFELFGHKVGKCCVRNKRSGCSQDTHCCNEGDRCYDGYCMVEKTPNQALRISKDGEWAEWATKDVAPDGSFGINRGHAVFGIFGITFCICCNLTYCYCKMDGKKKEKYQRDENGNVILDCNDDDDGVSDVQRGHEIDYDML